MTNANNTRRTVMTNAWAIYRKGGQTFSQSLKSAWAAHKNQPTQEVVVKYQLAGNASEIAAHYAPNASAVVFTRFEPRGAKYCSIADLDTMTGRVYLVPIKRGGFVAYYYPQSESKQTFAADNRSKAQKFDDLYNEGVYGEGNYNPYR